MRKMSGEKRLKVLLNGLTPTFSVTQYLKIFKQKLEYNFIKQSLLYVHLINSIINYKLYVCYLKCRISCTVQNA